LALEKDFPSTFISIERKKTLLRFIGVSLIAVLDGKQKTESRNTEEWTKKARESLEQLQEILKTQGAEDPRAKEEEAFVTLHLARVGTYEGKPITDLIDQTNAVRKLK